jgi:hypothetical protein
MMNSFWIGLVCVFAIIVSIHSQACNWTSCEPRNQVQCPPGYVEKLKARCNNVSLYLLIFEDKNDINRCTHI